MVAPGRFELPTCSLAKGPLYPLSYGASPRIPFAFVDSLSFCESDQTDNARAAAAGATTLGRE